MTERIVKPFLSDRLSRSTCFVCAKPSMSMNFSWSTFANRRFIFTNFNWASFKIYATEKLFQNPSIILRLERAAWLFAISLDSKTNDRVPLRLDKPITIHKQRQRNIRGYLLNLIATFKVKSKGNKRTKIIKSLQFSNKIENHALAQHFLRVELKVKRRKSLIVGEFMSEGRTARGKLGDVTFLIKHLEVLSRTVRAMYSSSL